MKNIKKIIKEGVICFDHNGGFDIILYAVAVGGTLWVCAGCPGLK